MRLGILALHVELWKLTVLTNTHRSQCQLCAIIVLISILFLVIISHLSGDWETTTIGEKSILSSTGGRGLQ